MSSPALNRCLGGVVPPISTPLLPDERVDVDSLLRLRHWLLDGGVSGIFALGSTGEASYLTDTARRRVVDTLASAKDGEALLVGVLGTTTARVLEAVYDLVDDRVDAIVATAPFYANVSPTEVLRHFEILATQSPVPVLAYNIPSNVGYALGADLMLRLLAEGLVAGIKDSSPDLTAFRQVTTAVAQLKPAPLLFTGSDALLDLALAAGANGAVPGLANVAPDLFVQALAAHRDGEHYRLEQIMRTLGTLVQLHRPTDPLAGPNATGVGAIKTALMLQGVIDFDTVSAPMTATTEERRGYVRSVLERAGRVKPAAASATVGETTSRDSSPRRRARRAEAAGRR
jgi:4-hydroxy-tetrahydrodipicolinate synthase